MTAALDRSEAVPHFDLLRGCGKVGHRDQYVVELQSYESSRPAVYLVMPMPRTTLGPIATHTSTRIHTRPALRS